MSAENRGRRPPTLASKFRSLRNMFRKDDALISMGNSRRKPRGKEDAVYRALSFTLQPFVLGECDINNNEAEIRDKAGSLARYILNIPEADMVLSEWLDVNAGSLDIILDKRAQIIVEVLGVELEKTRKYLENILE